MKLGICIPEAGPVGVPLLKQLHAFGYDAIRNEVNPVNHEATTAMLQEFAALPELYPIVLVGGGSLRQANGEPWQEGDLVAHTRDACIKMRDIGLFDRKEQLAIEIGNEPDLAHDHWKKHPERMAREFRRCYEVVREFSVDCPVLTPCISNLDADSFDYLEKMLESGIPYGADLAFHRYPRDRSVKTPQRGFRSRRQELSRLLQLAGSRPLWLTETGMQEGPHGNPDEPDSYLSEEEVAQAFEDEVGEWIGVPKLQAVIWYGLNDGPNRKERLHNYGIRRVNGTWKQPITRRVTKVKKALESVA